MVVELWVRDGWSPRLKDEAVQHMVSHDPDLAKQGYVVDRLKPIEAEKVGPSWHYTIPVRSVAN